MDPRVLINGIWYDALDECAEFGQDLTLEKLLALASCARRPPISLLRERALEFAKTWRRSTLDGVADFGPDAEAKMSARPEALPSGASETPPTASLGRLPADIPSKCLRLAASPFPSRALGRRVAWRASRFVSRSPTP